MRLPLVLIFVGAASLAAGGAVAEQRRSGPELLKAAERSFSTIPFGTKAAPRGLKLINDGGCEQGECSYLDANHVGHYFGADGGVLVVKWVSVADVGDGAISALGIGKARSQQEVLHRVRRFLPEAKIDCDEGSSETLIQCGATLGKGWIRLFFDKSHRLNEARIDAYHFT